MILYMLIKSKRLRNKENSLDFFKDCYLDKFFFWDFVIMAKKYILIASAVIYDDTRYFAIWFNTIIFISFLSQVFYQPYKWRLVNRAATYGRIANFSTAIFLYLKSFNKATLKPLPDLIFIFGNILFISLIGKNLILLNKKILCAIKRLLFFLPSNTFYYLDDQTGTKVRFPDEKKLKCFKKEKN
jgi:hypothetical protein